MKRTIIALVTAGLPFAAAAEVTLYGQIKSSVSAGQVRIKGGSGTEKSPTVTKINDNTSRIGFKGSEKIGDDLKAIWQVEQRTSVLNESKVFTKIISKHSKYVCPRRYTILLSVLFQKRKCSKE